MHLCASSLPLATGQDPQHAIALATPAGKNSAAGPRDRTDALDAAPVALAGFVAVSRFAVAAGTEQVKQAFGRRPHLVDRAPGFLRMDVLSPCDAPDEIWLLTYWTDETSYRTWHHSHLYKESHQGIPQGLRLAPKSVSLRFFEHVAS